MIIIAGTFILNPQKRKEFIDVSRSMIEATRLEKGCETYSFCEDPYDNKIVRVFEIWDTQENLQAHIASDHSQHWNKEILPNFKCENNVLKYAIKKVGAIEDWDI